jgi:hypothetical protein
MNLELRYKAVRKAGHRLRLSFQMNTEKVLRERNAMDKFDRIIEFAMKKDVELYTSMPSGWRRIIGALTAPCGSTWIYNGKSYFSGERKTALLVKEDCLE